MRVSISLRLANDDWQQAGAYVVEAERLGVDCLWAAEARGRDAATPLAFMAARTSRIRLGTGIMQAGTRTPALLAMTAMSLNAMSGGRFLLGLGVSGPRSSRMAPHRFDRPLRGIGKHLNRAACGAGRAPSPTGQDLQLPLPGGEG